MIVNPAPQIAAMAAANSNHLESSINPPECILVIFFGLIFIMLVLVIIMMIKSVFNLDLLWIILL